jgi:hypothetical protein
MTGKRCVQLSRFQAEDTAGYPDFALISIRDFVAPPPELQQARGAMSSR